MSDTFSVYRIVNFVNGKCYIGQTNDATKRRGYHFTRLKGGYHSNQHLQNAYNLYGRGSFYFEVLERGIAPDAICDRERYWIAHFDSFKNGYNKTSGGYKGFANEQAVSCVWNGVEYQSISAAARANGVTDSGMSHRLKQGYVCDDDITHAASQSCVWNGVKYKSICEAARVLGMQMASLRKYLLRGYASDEDVKLKMRPFKKPCMWNGIEYESKTAAARACGIVPASMDNRLRMGHTCDADLVSPTAKRP